MIEGLEQADVNKVQEEISNQINDLANTAATAKGRNVNFTYGKIIGLITVSRMISQAQEGDL